MIFQTLFHTVLCSCNRNAYPERVMYRQTNRLPKEVGSWVCWYGLTQFETDQT